MMGEQEDNERSRPRVCVVGSGFRFYSGISVYTCRLGNALADRFDVSALLVQRLLPVRFYPGRRRVGTNLSRLRYDDRVAVLEGVDWLWGPPFARCLLHVWRRRPDVLVFQYWTATTLHSYLALALLARSVRIPVVTELHEVQDVGEAERALARRYSELLLPLLLRLSGGAVVHSKQDQKTLEQLYPDGRRAVAVIPHGPFDHLERVNGVEAQPVDDGVTRLLYFGVIRAYKGVEDLIRAFNALPAEVAAKFHLTVVGETWEGWDLPAELIAGSPNRSRIEFINRYVTDDEAAGYFQRADAVVLPYRRSSASGPLHVAMGYGIAAVFYAVEALLDAADSYDGAIPVPTGDVDALREALLTLPARRCERYADPRSWADTTDAYENLIADVRSAGRPGGRYSRRRPARRR